MNSPMTLFLARACACFFLCIASATARADEGMWLFNAPPREALQARYGFEPGDEWLEHLMKASIKFGTASASFVSADGLVITNHHVGRSRLQQLSTADRDLMRDGFYARTSAEELKCPGTTVTVLQSIEDVTARLAGTSGAERRKLVADLERESREKTGLQSTVVNLYQGGRAHLYRVKRYTDVRLVFAPEFEVAHFGGDVDNFEYPRFCLDVCFFRVYENGQPLRPAHFLKWSAAGAREGDLVFVSGHPGVTDRLLTVAQLEYMRDVQLPYSLEGLRRQEVTLKNWGARDRENARRASRYLLSIENSRKRYDGQLSALQDAQFFSALQRAETEFKQELAAAGRTAATGAFDRIAAVQREMARDYVRHQMLVTSDAFASQAALLARSVIAGATGTRAGGREASATEPAQPNPAGEAREQASEVAQTAQATVDPFYDDLEIVRLTASLTRMTERLGAADPVVQRILTGKSPAARATELTKNSQVRDAAFRRKIIAGGAAALEASDDPWLLVLRGLEDEVRALRQRRTEQLDAIRVAHTAIADARFELRGTNMAPDATGTLRLSFGAVRGYRGEAGAAPATTDFAGMFARAARHERRAPFSLPARWRERESRINLQAPLDFVSTLDTVGGNSGSPIVNRAGEFVGILFDGDLPGLSRAFAYDEERGRSIGVHSAGIEEALRSIFDAEALLRELQSGGRGGN